MIWTSEELSKILGVKIKSDIIISNISIDTRNLKEKALFIALEGEKNDGHEFVREAFKNGAVLALVSKLPMNIKKEDLIVVEDVKSSILKLSIESRNRSNAIRIGITGSNGKTTTKEMLKFLLSENFRTHANLGNYNNDLGVKLTLLSMPKQIDFAIFEMGMNNPGELSNLSNLVRPYIALITNICEAHIENLGSREGIAKAKAEIFHGLSSNGIAILNYDDEFFDFLSQQALKIHNFKIITFGKNVNADICLLNCILNENGSQVKAKYKDVELDYFLPCSGYHLVLNSLAVLAIIVALDLNVAEFSLFFQNFSVPKGRGNKYSINLINKGTITLFDQSYNCNPTSMKASIETLGLFKPKNEGRRIAVIGDMAELGNFSEHHHLRLKEVLEKEKIDLVFACGFQMCKLFETLPENMKAKHALNSNDLIKDLYDMLKADDVIMVKGSKSSNMNVIVEYLLKPEKI